MDPKYWWEFDGSKNKEVAAHEQLVEESTPTTPDKPRFLALAYRDMETIVTASIVPHILPISLRLNFRKTSFQQRSG